MPRRRAQLRGYDHNKADCSESDERLERGEELQQLEDDVKKNRCEESDGIDLAQAEFDDDHARWQQHVLERPHEGLYSLETLLTVSTYNFLTVLSLPHNVIEDISPVAYTAKTLRLLNLNGNAITQLPLPGDGFWPLFRSLTLLFLSGNGIASWGAMEGLAQAPKLLWLTIDGNPLMSLVNAREFLVNKLPLSLKALNDHVITDVEYIQHAGRSIRFGAQTVRLFTGDTLRVPSAFDEDDAVAVAYMANTDAAIRSIYMRNSPSVIVQRVVRGHLSRRYLAPRFTFIRKLIVRVQSTIRGFLFRRAVRIEFVQLVTEQGQQELLLGPMNDALFMTGGARRGLRRLVSLVQQWRIKYRAKKQAIAIKKIRFWCQLVYQRYRYRSQQLLQEQQEIFIYYTASFEDELLEMALKTVHRDPILMALTPLQREELVRQRCVASGVSVLRTPSQSRIVSASSPSSSTQQEDLPSTPLQIERENAAMGKLRKTLTPPLVRIFRKDQSLETNVLVTEKQLIQRDLAMLKQLKHQNQLDSMQPPHARVKATTKPSQRGVLVQISQLSNELERRLVIVNRKILAACLKRQQQKHKPPRSLSLTHVAIRVRGHAPTRPERRKWNRLLSSQETPSARRHDPTDYTRMRVFIPWSIDMYLQLMASLDRTLLLTNVSAGFALSYAQTRHVHAVVTIQSAWRAARCHCKRDALEVTIVRAAVCMQRWWRHCQGLRRRMAFVRACLLTCGAVNSTTLFMEASVYHLLSDAARWHTIVRPMMRPCREHAIHCLMVDGAVEISLAPSHMMLYTASTSASPPSSLWVTGDPGKVDVASLHRCGAYLPVWLCPGAPEHFEESMVSRDTDATPHLLVDHVHTEPTLIERELLLVGSTRGSNSSSVPSSADSENPFARFAVCRQVISVGARVMDLARKFSVEHRKAAPPATVTATSLVRLTFDSVQEARHRALVLVAKTFDPVTHSYAKLFTLEALVGASMLRHQWAVTQALGDRRGGGDAFLSDCKLWLQAELPSPWAQNMLARVPLDNQTPERNGLLDPRSVSGLVLSTASAPVRSSLLVPHRPAPPSVVAVPPVTRDSDGPAPLHIVEPLVLDKGIQPVPPSRPSIASPSPGSFSRHQQLMDRLGKPAYHSLNDLRQMQSRDRDVLVRDLREERERASEARIVDKRMIQREHAAELAGIHLEMHVKLQKIKYEQELSKIHTRELAERERMNEQARKLTRRFETSFVAQSGAMMRHAARRAVETKLITKETVRQAKAIEIRERDEDALARRQDAKSYWFVSNQRIKQRVDDTTEVGLATRESNEKKRHMRVRERVQEDKEIKKLLRLM